jgi:hypothetical protein
VLLKVATTLFANTYISNLSLTIVVTAHAASHLGTVSLTIAAVGKLLGHCVALEVARGCQSCQ